MSKLRSKYGNTTLSSYLQMIQSPDFARLAGRQRAALAAYMREEITARELQCLSLYYVDGLDLKQIAARLHISTSTICSNIKRGKARMMRVLRLAVELLGEDYVFQGGMV